jgi:trehalose 6-phosphate phosphatase
VKAPRPRPIDGRAPITERLSGTSGLLVGTDFDGVLAPIVDDPDDPLPTPENKRALRRLDAHPATVVAVISGRSLADLRPRVGMENLVYAGNHGLEIDRGGPTSIHPEARERRRWIREVCQAVAEAAGDAGILVEDKGLTATIHHREVPEPVRERVLSTVHAAVDRSQGAIRLSPGKASIELRPDVDWDKGSALLDLANDAPEGWAVIYLGDDETDEDAFEALGDDGISIHVGTDEDTAAGYRLTEQAEVAPFLNALAGEIHGESGGSENGGIEAPRARRAPPADGVP